MKCKNLLLGTAVACMIGFTGCASTGMTSGLAFMHPASYKVCIADGDLKTEMLVRSGDKIGDIFEDAGIAIGEKDQVILSEAEGSEIGQFNAGEELMSVKIDGDSDLEIGRYAKVTFVSDKEEKSVEMIGGHVGEAMEEAGIVLADHDYIDADPEEWLTDGQVIAITHRVEVTLTVDGKTETALTEAKTVKAYLKECGIKLGELDRISPKKSKKLKEGMEIIIQRVEKKTEKEKQAIAYGTSREYSGSMNKGQTKIKQEGQNGEKEITYEVIYVDGIEESREIVKEKVTKEAVDQIIVEGTYVAPSSKPSGGSSGGKTVVDTQVYMDCDGSGHGTKVITYSDGSKDTIRF